MHLEPNKHSKSLGPTRSSRLKVHYRCPRRGYFEYMLGLRYPISEAAAMGTLNHKKYELYFRGDMKLEQLPPMCRMGIETGIYPEPGPNVHAEQRFRFEYAGFDCWGTRDLRQDGRLWDHKFGTPSYHMGGSNHAAKLPEDDLQAVFYAMGLVMEGEPEVELTWVIHNKRSLTWTPRAFVSVLSAAEVRDRFDALCLPIMMDLRDTPRGRWQDIEPNPDACEDFEGCPHKPYCHITLDQIVNLNVRKPKKNGN